MAQFRDFSLASSSDPHSFRIAGHVFRVLPDIPLDYFGTLIDAIDSKAPEGEDQTIYKLRKSIDGIANILYPEDQKIFREKATSGTLEKPNLDPIGVIRIQQILEFVLEVYSARPTGEPSSPGDGSDTGNTNLTESVLGQV